MKDRLLGIFDKFYGGIKDRGSAKNDGDIKVYFAPGRVNLIGEHTDYNGGHVFPCALTIGTYAAVRLREDDRIRMYSDNFPDEGKLLTLLSLHIPVFQNPVYLQKNYKSFFPVFLIFSSFYLKSEKFLLQNFSFFLLVQNSLLFSFVLSIYLKFKNVRTFLNYLYVISSKLIFKA